MNNKLNDFIMGKDFLPEVFNNLKWLSISSLIAGVGVLFWKEGNVSVSVVSIIFAFFLFALTAMHGCIKIILPLLKIKYEKDLNEIETFGLLYAIKKISFWIYLLGSLAYILLALEWFKVLLLKVK